MKIDTTDLYLALSFALDAVEREAVGTSTGHAKRVAYLCMRMYAQTGAPIADQADFVGVALLHDCALSEYLREEYNVPPGMLEAAGGASDDPKSLANQLDVDYEVLVSGARHCIVGERNVGRLPFHSDVRGSILWHHENADGSGPLHLKASQTNLKSQLIHLSDATDMIFDLHEVDQAKYDRVCAFVEKNRGRMFSDQAVDLFHRAISLGVLEAMSLAGAEDLLRAETPMSMSDYSFDEVVGIAEFFAGIVDYKSAFTKRHSMGVAEKARRMAIHYGWDEDMVTRFYFAGALHDVGKMIVPNGILEKPDRLTSEEFGKMRDHAAATRFVLSRIQGMEDICEWASNHHEKLDGSGYSLGLRAEDLSFEERLMGCIDVYQALTEKRPYKEGLAHPQAIALMRNMARDNKIDGVIVEDMDRLFGDGTQVAASDLRTKGQRLWKCPVCGFVYEGPEPPATCPLCGAQGYRFLPME